MPKVAPYYSTSTTDPDVYHDQSDCPSGSQILPENKASGTGGYRKCQTCASMG